MTGVEPRRCAFVPCSKPLTPRPAVGGGKPEYPAAFANRRFCDAVCARRKQAADQAGDLPSEKSCEGCGVTMVWSGRRPGDWRVKRFCTSECAARSRARPTPAAPSGGPDSAGSSEVWRPAGWSPTPNTWAGHRPPEQEAAS